MTVAEALRSRDPSLLPGKRQEGWRWTDLRGLLRDLPEPSPEPKDFVKAGGPFAGIEGAEFVIANGRGNWWPEDDLPTGVEMFEYAAPDAPVRASVMGALAAEFAENPSVSIIKVARGVEATLRLRFVSNADAGTHHARVGVIVEPGARVTLLESYESVEAGTILANHLVELFVCQGASLTRIIIADDDAEATSVSDAAVVLNAGAVFTQTILTSGARRQRIETRVTHPGAGAAVRMDGVYVLRDRRHADITTAVVHDGRDGVTAQLTKGVVDGQARGVFQGRIEVLKGADGTDARMGHHALILSERAEVDALPQLEIYADDVACSHGNTVGSLDEAALFYARSRGMPEDDARAMLTVAFLGEVIDRIEREDVREVARAWLERRLGRA